MRAYEEGRKRLKEIRSDQRRGRSREVRRVMVDPEGVPYKHHILLGGTVAAGVQNSVEPIPVPILPNFQVLGYRYHTHKNIAVGKKLNLNRKPIHRVDCSPF